MLSSPMVFTANVAAPIFWTLALAFFVVVVLSVAFCVYAAKQMKKMERQLQEIQEQ